MKYKSKRHLTLSLKKKAGVELTDAEVKELLGIEGTPETKEDPKKEEPKKEEAKPEDKPADKKEAEQAPAGDAATIETLSKQIAAITENMQMMMEALSAVLEGQAAPAAGDEAKGDDKPAEDKEEPKKDEEKKSEEDKEEEQTEEEMEKELEKTIAEIESLED